MVAMRVMSGSATGVDAGATAAVGVVLLCAKPGRGRPKLASVHARVNTLRGRARLLGMGYGVVCMAASSVPILARPLTGREVQVKVQWSWR